jgi:hypothetical protein
MDSVFVDEETTLHKFAKSNEIDANIIHNYRRHNPTHKHPPLVFEQLYEVPTLSI